MYYTGIDPFTMNERYVARHLRDRKLQGTLPQFYKPETYFDVPKALIEAGRADLIGGGCDCLMPAQPSREALQQRRENANRAARGARREYVHRMPKPERRTGYRPG